MKKRILAFLLLLVTMFCFSGCADDDMYIVEIEVWEDKLISYYSDGTSYVEYLYNKHYCFCSATENYDCYFLNDDEMGIQIGKNYTLENIEFPKYIRYTTQYDNYYYESYTVTKIMSQKDSVGDYPECAIKTITIPKTVKSIGDYAFANIPTLETVIFEEGSVLENIGKGAFKNCKNLTTIVLPETATNVSSDAFEGCDKLVK